MSKLARGKRTFYDRIAREVSKLTRYCDRVVQWQPSPSDTGYLLARVDAPEKSVAAEEAALAASGRDRDDRTVVLMNGTLNRELDIQALLTRIHAHLSRGARIVVVAYNPYLALIYRLATVLGFREKEPTPTFVTATALRSLCKLSGYEIVRMRPVGWFPWKLLGLGTLFDRLLSLTPLIRQLSIVQVITIRPVIREKERPSLSIVIPARNERGNIEAALERMPDLGAPVEIIFVEGHSNDGTLEEIQRVAEAWRDRFDIQVLQQSGRGKSDAVRLGLSKATGDLLTILDADLTMPPELLDQFYSAWVRGLADFINGSRLVYPIEGEAMRFLNRLGNVFFAKLLSFVLDTPISDSLCGTKLLARRDYERMIAWRRGFGDFDPFGDFELLFPAAVLGLGVIDVPVRYRARTYGTTNIRRFRDGLRLLNMTAIGFWRVKL